VTDVGQGKHFNAVFDAANRAGWLDTNVCYVETRPFKNPDSFLNHLLLAKHKN